MVWNMQSIRLNACLGGLSGMYCGEQSLADFTPTPDGGKNPLAELISECKYLVVYDRFRR